MTIGPRVALSPLMRLAAGPDVAVILAAGNGSRMNGETPKPLLRVHGTRLLERAILSLHRAGVKRFVVVTGAYTDEIAAVLPRLPRLRGLAIEQVHCATWEHGNGHSLACGAIAAGGAFYLAMADHVFDPAIVTRLGAAAVAEPDAVHLATDGDVPGVFDLDDATKVVTRDGAIVEIGKDLPAFDRVDVGVFACPASLGASAARAIAAGGNSVSDVMRDMIARGRMRSVSIDGALWQDVDTPAMRDEAERRLLAASRKASDGPVSRWLNRPISLALTRVLARAHVTPNMVTSFVFALGIMAAVLISLGAWWQLIAAAALVQFASIVDGCDGELARIDLRASRFGAWYDTITDNLRFAAMVACCGVGLYRRDGDLGYLAAGAVFVAAAAYLVITMTAYLRRTGSAGTHLVIVAKLEAEAAREVGVFRLLYRIRVLVKQDVLAALAAVTLALNLPQVVLALGIVAVVLMIIAVDRTVGRPGRGLRFGLGVGGVALLSWLITQAPLDAIARAVRSMGWPVVLAIPIALTWIVANSLGLRALLRGRVRFAALVFNRIVGDGYNAIVPAAGVGGEPVRIALLRAHLPATEAAVAVVNDRAINLISGLLVSAAAIAIAAVALTLPAPLVAVAWIYAGCAFAVGFALLAVICRGMSGRLVAVIGGWVSGTALYATPIPVRTIAVTLAWNVFGRALSALEVALYAKLLGLPLSALEVVFVTGVLHAVGITMFVVPQGIGVAEAAAVYALGALGYPPAIALAFALVRRARLLVFSAAAVALHLGARWVAARPPLGAVVRTPSS